MGTGKYLKEKWPNIKIIAIEPAESPVMSGGEPGLHGIQGIGDGSKFLVDLDFVDEVHTIKTSTQSLLLNILQKNMDCLLELVPELIYIPHLIGLEKIIVKMP